MVTVKMNGKYFKLDRQEFQNYMLNLWQKAQAKKAAREDMIKEFKKQKGETA